MAVRGSNQDSLNVFSHPPAAALTSPISYASARLQMPNIGSSLLNPLENPSVTNQLLRLQVLNSLAGTRGLAETQPALAGLSPRLGLGMHQQQQLQRSLLHPSLNQSLGSVTSSPHVAMGHSAVAASLSSRLQEQGIGAPPLYSGGLASSLTQSRQNVSIPGLGKIPALSHQASQPRFRLSLPSLLSQPEDSMKLSDHQVLLRLQIEAFKATEVDASTHTRGRNKQVQVGQVGIRCRHCAHLPITKRKKGSTYFPASLMGVYQAAQNMSTTHIQCGVCPEMPENIKQEFVRLMLSRSTSSGAGRPYWAASAKAIGLLDTDDGIRFIGDFMN